MDQDLVIEEVLRRWPQTVPVFLRHRMACVGCTMAPFETVAEAATTYGIAGLLAELEAVVRDGRG